MNSPKLTWGMRFVLKNQECEITHVDANKIRYSTCAGGKPKLMPTATFWELVDAEGVTILLPEQGKNGYLPIQDRLATISEPQRLEMLRRFRYVKEALQKVVRICSHKNLVAAIQSVVAQTADQDAPAPSTLAKWIKDYRESNCQVVSLVPQHQNKGPQSKQFPELVEKIIFSEIGNAYLTQECPSIEQIRCNAVSAIAEACGSQGSSVTVPSPRTFYRRVAELDPYIVDLKRHGKRYADARHRAAGAAIETSRIMQLVMIDGHRMDVLVVDEKTGEVLGRPNLVCLFDAHTRAIVGWFISLLPFCATTALAAIKDMCSRDPTREPGGVPEGILPDNGKDLSSVALRNLCQSLCMHIFPAKTYCPDDKAFLERFFRTLNQTFVHMLPGTTFSSPQARGHYDAEGNARLTLEQVRSLFVKWREEVYHAKKHSSTLRMPGAAWREQQAAMPLMWFAKGTLDAIARVAFSRVINNGRVIVNYLAYRSDALAMLESRDQRDVTVLVDELDLSCVYVKSGANPHTLIRADCTRIKYSHDLTKYEHDQVLMRLKEASRKDLEEMGEYAYEKARRDFWEEIQELSGRRKKKRSAGLATSKPQTPKEPPDETLESERSPAAASNAQSIDVTDLQVPITPTVSRSPLRNTTAPDSDCGTPHKSAIRVRKSRGIIEI